MKSSYPTRARRVQLFSASTPMEPATDYANNVWGPKLFFARIAYVTVLRPVDKIKDIAADMTPGQVSFWEGAAVILLHIFGDSKR